MKLPAGAAPVDLTQTIENGMPIYVGDAVPKVSKFKTLSKDGVNLSLITLGSHTGTHVDAPIHFVKGGVPLDRLPADAFVGEAAILDLSEIPAGSPVLARHLQAHAREVRRGDIVLLYTGMSRKWLDPRARRKYTYIGADAARWLVKRGARAVGVDYLSVEEYGARSPVAHLTLLSNGIPIIESLSANLAKLAGGRALFVCLPIKVGGCDGAPARAIAYPLKGGRTR